MHRLFVALRPPEPIRDLLCDVMDGIPAARWQDDAQLHLTLRFIGEVDGGQAEDIAASLAMIAAPAPTVAVRGVGSFASRGSVHTLWAGVAPAAPLAALHHKVDRALVTAGVTPDRRAYVPHITLARMARSAGGDPAIGRWLAAHAMLASPEFLPDRLILYESVLTRGGAQYLERAAWPLG